MKKFGRYLYILIGFILGAAICGGTIATAASITATLTEDKVFVNGAEVNVEVYKINGSNYFKLRDIAGAVDFSVVYDSGEQRVLIDPSRLYDPNEQYAEFLTPTENPAPVVTPTPTATPTPVPSFIMFQDDGSSKNTFMDIAYMGMYSDGNDGSISMNVNDTSTTPKFGRVAMKFTYKPTNTGSHWSGAALLWETQNWKAKGPDLSQYSKLTFWVCGNGGEVKFFIEGDGVAQKTTYVTLTKDWQKITLALGNWDYVNVPFGWACNESNPDAKGGTITFWVDGLQFE